MSRSRGPRASVAALSAGKVGAAGGGALGPQENAAGGDPIEETAPHRPERTLSAVRPGAPAEPSGLAALRARLNLFGEAVYVRLRWHLRKSFEDLRTRDHFFRWKAGIVAGWIALSLVSLGVARSSATPTPGANRLQAYVVIRPTTMGWGLLVQNQSKRNWKAVEIHLDGFTHRTGELAAGQQLILGPFEFERHGETLPESHIPQAVEISTDRGSMIVELVE